MQYQPAPLSPPRRVRISRRMLLALNQRALMTIMIVCAVFVVLLAPMAAAPASASFSINTSELMDQASSMFNALWPVFGIIVGISVGVALAILIANKFSQAFKSAG